MPPDPKTTGKSAQAREIFSPDTNVQSMPASARYGINRVEKAISLGKKPRDCAGVVPHVCG